MRERSPLPGSPVFDGICGVGSAERMPGSLGDGSQTYGDLLAVSLSGFSRSVGFWSWVGFRERQGARDWPCGGSFPFRCSSQTPHPERPLLCLPGPRGRVAGSWAPGPGPGDRRPALRFVGSSGALVADPVGNSIQGRETSSESGSIATALHFLSPLRLCAIAKGPGGSIGVTTQSKWIHVLPGWRTRKSRLKFGLISWGGSQGWREIERVKSGEERSLDSQKELLLARLSFEIGDLPLFAC